MLFLGFLGIVVLFVVGGFVPVVVGLFLAIIICKIIGIF
jgi:hypothetical protein